MVGWEQVGRFGGLRRGRLGLFGWCGWPLEFWLLSFSHPSVRVVPLWSRAGSHASAGGASEVARPLFLLGVLDLQVVLFEADVPGQAADGGHGLKLVDDVSRDEVNVVVAELDAGIANALPPQLVELGIIHPLDALWGEGHVIERAAPPSDAPDGLTPHLRHRRLVQVQLQTLDHFMEISSLETHHVFGYPGLVVPGNTDNVCRGNFNHENDSLNVRCVSSHHSPKCTAFSTPTAAVLCQSKVWPTWSAWALVRSSNRTSLGSLALGR